MSDFKLTTTIGAAERLRDKPLEDVLAGMDTEWEGLRHDLHAEVKHWPERVAEALPAPDLTITFTSENANEKERYIEVV